jgi:hypothetical protein
MKEAFQKPVRYSQGTDVAVPEQEPCTLFVVRTLPAFMKLEIGLLRIGVRRLVPY